MQWQKKWLLANTATNDNDNEVNNNVDDDSSNNDECPAKEKKPPGTLAACCKPSSGTGAVWMEIPLRGWVRTPAMKKGNR